MITLKDVDPNMIANNLTPQHVSAPGYLLADEIAERGITVERFAQLTGIDVESLRGIIDGQAPITPAHAMIFEAALGIRANIWREMCFIVLSRTSTITTQLTYRPITTTLRRCCKIQILFRRISFKEGMKMV